MWPRTRRTSWVSTNTTSASSASTARSSPTASPTTSVVMTCRCVARADCVDGRALFVDLTEEPEAQESRERVPQEETSAGDTDRETGDRQRRVGVGVEDVEVRAGRRGD